MTQGWGSNIAEAYCAAILRNALAAIRTGWRIGLTPAGGYQVYRQDAPGLHIYFALSARDALRIYKERVNATQAYQSVLSDPGERRAVRAEPGDNPLA